MKLDLQGMLYQKTDIFPLNPAKNLVFDIVLSLGALYYFPQL